MDDFYETLKVPTTATKRQIKKAYRKLSLQFHPDRAQDDQKEAFEENFLKITRAYETLGNQEKREIYDASHGLTTDGSYIKSKFSVTLTKQNYQRLVTSSTHFWVIQVLTHDSSAAQSLSASWDALAEKYGKFLKFGRIDFKSQMALQANIPFRVAEIPFIYVYRKGMEPDFAEFKRGESVISSIKRLLVKKFPRGYQPQTFVELSTFLTAGELLEGSPKLVHVTENKLDQNFHFDSQFYQKEKGYLASKRADYALITGFLKSSKLIKNPKSRFLVHSANPLNPSFDKKITKGFNGYEEASNFYNFLNKVDFDSETFERLCLPKFTFVDGYEEPKVLCVITRPEKYNKIARDVYTEFLEEYKNKGLGPKSWFEGSLVGRFVMGTYEEKTQPILGKFFEVAGADAVVYHSDGKLSVMKAGVDLLNFLEDCFVQDDDEDETEQKKSNSVSRQKFTKNCKVTAKEIDSFCFLCD